MRRSSVFSVYVDALPWARDMQGQPIVGQLATGFVLLTDLNYPVPAGGTHAKARHVLEAAPGVAIPAGVAQVVADGSKGPWNPAGIAKGWPDGKKHVLCAEWNESIDGKVVRVRGRSGKRPAGKPALADDIIPHQWAGDGAPIA